MNLLLGKLILLGMVASVHWNWERFDAFCNRIETLINQEDIPQEVLDDLIREFELEADYTTPFDSPQPTP